MTPKPWLGCSGAKFHRVAGGARWVTGIWGTRLWISLDLWAQKVEDNFWGNCGATFINPLKDDEILRLWDSVVKFRVPRHPKAKQLSWSSQEPESGSRWAEFLAEYSASGVSSLPMISILQYGFQFSIRFLSQS